MTVVSVTTLATPEPYIKSECCHQQYNMVLLVWVYTVQYNIYNNNNNSISETPQVTVWAPLYDDFPQKSR